MPLTFERWSPRDAAESALGQISVPADVAKFGEEAKGSKGSKGSVSVKDHVPASLSASPSVPSPSRISACLVPGSHAACERVRSS